MSRLWRWWVSACTTTESATSLALIRIALGLSVLWALGSVVSTDTVDALWVDARYGGVRNLMANPLVDALGGARPNVIHGLVTALGVLGAALTMGLGGRVTPLLTLFGIRALTARHPEAGGSYDLLLHNGLWLCVLAPTTTTLSLDAWLGSGSFVRDTPVGRWARYLFVFQLVLMYTSTGWQKLSAYWTPGGDFSALYYIFQQPSWQRVDLAWTAWIYPLTQVGTAVSWFWEVTGPLLLLAVWAEDHREGATGWRRTLVRWRVRDVFVGIGLIMHVVLLVLMNVGPFTPITLSFYPALFAPRAWDRLLRRS